MFPPAFRQRTDARYPHVYSFLVIALLLFLPACDRGQQHAQVAKPKTLTTDDLKKLRWIEGSWRGTGVNQPPFFERYRFENDTTLAIDYLEDETLAKVTNTGRYELKNGEFRGGSGTRQYVATALDDNSISFVPASAGGNSFIWKRESKDSWTAILSWPASAEEPAGQRTYNMERWPKP